MHATQDKSGAVVFRLSPAEARKRSSAKALKRRNAKRLDNIEAAIRFLGKELPAEKQVALERILKR